MNRLKARRPTIGVLSGWEVYDKAILLNFIGPLLRGVRAAAHERDSNLLLACGVRGGFGDIRPAWPVPATGVDFVPVGPWNTDGLIAVNPFLSQTRIAYIRELAAAGHPVAYVGTAQGGPAVGIDNEGGIRQAMAHLVEHGHQRIAFIAGNPADMQGDSEERLMAYQAAMRHYNLQADPSLIVYGYHLISGGQEAIQQLLGSGVKFTAVLASSDESAIGAMQALKEAGLRIPQDVAVIGFDDLPEAVFQAPPLTSVHSLTYERGYKSVELLLDIIAGRSERDEIVNIPTRLLIRQSCGCQTEGLPATGSGRPVRTVAEIGGEAVLEELAVNMAETVLAETRSLNSVEVQAHCRRLVRAFVASLEQQGDATGFDLVLGGILQRVETKEDDAHEWQLAISVLRDGIALLPELAEAPEKRQRAEEMLNRARIAISEAERWQFREYVDAQRQMSERISQLTSRLLAVLDEAQIYEILAEHLPEMKIDHAGVAFFEAEADDAAAHSVLHAVSNGEVSFFRFPSREFPPKGLYLKDRPFSLALLPLVIAEESVGYVAFEASNLELYGAIAQQLIAAIRSSRLYRQATDGQRLAEEGRQLAEQGRGLAEEANRMKSRLLSTVSHELRTPLNLIVGLSKMMLHEKMEKSFRLPRPFQKDVERIHASAQQLDGLIRDVLDLTRSEMGKLKLTYQALDLHEVLQVVAVAGEQLAQEKGLNWRVEIPESLPQVWGDQARLRQVALNLVSNAVKFTERGEVALRVEMDGETVTVSVSDTGLGIAKNEQGLIFDEFRQSERTTARGYGGLGLGLAICKRLIERHGGEIGVQSSGKEGAGSRFYFTLPVAKSQSVLEPAGAMPQITKGTVLLMIEGPGNEKRLHDYLLRQGFEVETMLIDASSQSLPHILVAPPGAVVLGKELAAKRGWEILKLLKENPASENVPVLFYALEHEQDSGSLLELDYLRKPMGAAELAQALDRQGLLTGQNGREKTILVVDDDPEILEMHVRVLQALSASHRILKAKNGLEALEIARAEKPDLVLLDLMMPELDGFGVLEAMRQDEATSKIPVIVLSAQALTEENMEQLNQGVAAVLGKGLFSAQETLAHIELALARKKKLGNDIQRLVRKALAYIHAHYAEPLSRDDLANYVGVSNDYLTRGFRQEMGVTPVVYLNRYRISQAKTLLLSGDNSITKIATAVGFSDSSYFSQVFRREVGVSPNAYRHAFVTTDKAYD